MVKIIPGNGKTCLESLLEITEGQADLIKSNKKKVEEMCRDLHVQHLYYKSEDGNFFSEISHTVSEESDAASIVKELNEIHHQLLNKIDNLSEETGEPSAEEEFFLVHKTEIGYKVSGNMHPAKVIDALKAAIFFNMIKHAE